MKTKKFRNRVTGSTIGDICMIRFSDCIDKIVSLQDFFVLPGLQKLFGVQTCSDLRANLSDAIAILSECGEACFIKLTDHSVEHEEV